MQTLTHLQADGLGISHFVEVTLPLAQPHSQFPLQVTELFCSQQVLLWQAGPLELQWVNAPQRQCFLYLAGSVSMTAGDGEVRQFGPGDLLMVEDTTGQGHCTCIPDGLKALVIQALPSGA
jgi:hypothetical protein